MGCKYRHMEEDENEVKFLSTTSWINRPGMQLLRINLRGGGGVLETSSDPDGPTNFRLRKALILFMMRKGLRLFTRLTWVVWSDWYDQSPYGDWLKGGRIDAASLTPQIPVNHLQEGAYIRIFFPKWRDINTHILMIMRLREISSF